MKKLIILCAILGWVLLALSFTSCKKKEVCVSCYEAKSGLQVDDFCGSEFEAETYIDALVNDGWAITDWRCEYN